MRLAAAAVSIAVVVAVELTEQRPIVPGSGAGKPRLPLTADQHELRSSMTATCQRAQAA